MFQVKATLHMLDHNIELIGSHTKVSIHLADAGADKNNPQEAEGDEKDEVKVSLSPFQTI